MGMSERERGLLLKLQAATQALADVRTLDDWAGEHTSREHSTTRDQALPHMLAWTCELRPGKFERGKEFSAPTPDEARANAAAWVRKLAEAAAWVRGQK